MHECSKTSRVTLTSRYFSFHHILICFIYMLVSNSDDNKEQFMSSNEKIGSVITLCNLLKFNINMKYLHISCLYYLCNFWSFFLLHWLHMILYTTHKKVIRFCSNKRFCVTRSGQKQWNIVVYHYQNKTPGYDHILQKDCQISNGENSYGNSILQKL